MGSPEEVSHLRDRPTRELLGMYAATLSILLDRGVIRTRNAPAGDLAEKLVEVAYRGALERNSTKSYDVLTHDNQRVQVKCRVLKTATGSQVYSVFRSWDFDRCVFVRLDPDTYDVLAAVDVPVDVVRLIARHSAHVKGDRVRVAAPLLTLEGAQDVRAELQCALEGLDAALADAAELDGTIRPLTAGERIRGCLLAGAVGDALGAGIEFDSWDRIRKRFGADGLRAYGRMGAITDDTQMTLFTAEGLIRALNRMAGKGICSTRHVVHHAYRRWLATQDGRHDTGHDGWLITVPGLWHSRAPGNTCLSALHSGQVGSVQEPINDSKGCGGVMRAAPVGFLVGEDSRFRLGCDVAAITHGHPDGYLPAGALAVIVGGLVDGVGLATALDAAEERLCEAPSHENSLAALRAGRAAGVNGLPTPEALEALGGGWVGEEALAIAVACVVGGIDRPADALLAAVNHSGDTDSTGSIAGNLLGAAHGAEWLPTPWLEELELREVIEQMAKDCDRAAKRDQSDMEGDSDWWERYPGW